MGTGNTRAAKNFLTKISSSASSQVLNKIDKFLAELLEFNKAIVQFDAVLTGLDSWINGKGKVWKMDGQCV